MKKILLSGIFIIIFFPSFCQQTDTTRTNVTQAPLKDYGKISRSQKTAAWVLLGVGVGMIAIAAPGNVSFDVLPILVIGGGAAAIGSIPLFIASARNKKKAVKASANFQIMEIQKVGNLSMKSTIVPGVNVKINF